MLALFVKFGEFITTLRSVVKRKIPAIGPTNKNAKDVNENLANHEKITKNLPVLSNEDIAHVV